MGLRFLRHPDHNGPGPTDPPQGTVTGTVDMGTINGPKQAPPVTQFGGDKEILNTTTILNEGGAWPGNPGQAIISAPGAREFLFDTRAELQAQPAPGRILRQLFARVWGYTGAGADAVGTNGYPWNGDWTHIPHLPVPRRPYGPSPYARQWDNNAPISAVYAGNPRGGQ